MFQHNFPTKKFFSYSLISAGISIASSLPANALVLVYVANPLYPPVPESFSFHVLVQDSEVVIRPVDFLPGLKLGGFVDLNYLDSNNDLQNGRFSISPDSRDGNGKLFTPVNPPVLIVGFPDQELRANDPNNSLQASPVPAPLPILGIGASLLYSKRLMKQSKRLRSSSPKGLPPCES